MNKYLKLNLDFLKKIKNSKKKDSQAININRYWHIILILTLIIIFVFLSAGIYLVKESSEKEKKINTQINLPQDSSKGNKINSVLDYFKEREKKSEAIINNTTPLVIDPSL